MPRRRPTIRASQEQYDLYALQAEFCRVLGHPRRLAILDLLAKGERSGAELLGRLGVSKVNLSQHLSVMKRSGLVISRHEGREAFHRLAFPQLAIACRVTRRLLVQRLEKQSKQAKALRALRRSAR